MQVRLVIPICDHIINSFYCRDAFYKNERSNLLKKAFEIGFKKKKDSLPELVITSNNFLYFPETEDDVLTDSIKAFLKGFKPKENINLIIGIDSDVENPYGGISSKVYHFFYENKVWKAERSFWECWDECNEKRCLLNQNRYIENFKFLVFSCGDIFTSEKGNPCITEDKCKDIFEHILINKQKKITLLDLAHMDFKVYNRLSSCNLVEKIIATTQISRNFLQENFNRIKQNRENNYFPFVSGKDRGNKQKNSKGKKKIFYSFLRKKSSNRMNLIKDQYFIFLDKQGAIYEELNINTDTERGIPFEIIEKNNFLNKIDAFFIDVEI